jgi:hypothetical protein
MGSYAFDTAQIADERVLLETGEVGDFVSPGAVVSQPGSTAIQVRSGTRAMVQQNIQGLSGENVSALVDSLYQAQETDTAQLVSLASTALGSLAATASQAQEAQQAALLATETPDYGRWLPLLIVGAVALLYWGGR